jgi:hypothetical protein
MGRRVFNIGQWMVIWRGIFWDATWKFLDGTEYGEGYRAFVVRLPQFRSERMKFPWLELHYIVVGWVEFRRYKNLEVPPDEKD